MILLWSMLVQELGEDQEIYVYSAIRKWEIRSQAWGQNWTLLERLWSQANAQAPKGTQKDRLLDIVEYFHLRDEKRERMKPKRSERMQKRIMWYEQERISSKMYWLKHLHF